MPKLTARHEVILNYPLLLNCKDDISFDISQDKYEINIFIKVEELPKMVISGKTIKVANCLTISVSKDEEHTPEILTNNDGFRDFTSAQEYFKNRSQEYTSIYHEYKTRVINYFKYVLNQPHLGSDNTQITGITWKDDQGHDYGSLSVSVSSPIPPGMGSDKLNISHNIAELEKYVAEKMEVPTSAVILSDAQSAILNGDYRKAVIELAVAAEVSIKTKFFSDEKAIPALVYLHENSFLCIKPLEYITKVAKFILGESFGDVNKMDYENIDYVFRCRNQAAHKGMVHFKNSKGDTTYPDAIMMEQWYISVSNLSNWLNSKEIV